MFDSIRAWAERRRAMREIAEGDRIERERDEIRFREVLDRAESAMKADQFPAALRLCREMQERFYKQATQSEKFFNIILDLGAFDDAERVISAGLARFPREQMFLVAHAQVAERRGDIDIALERWAKVRKKFPGLALGYARTAACLVKAGRIREADAMLERGIRQSPEDVFCLIEHARLAETLGNFDEAVVRWQRLCNGPSDQTIFADNGTPGLGRCLRILGRFDEAEALLIAFNDRFGLRVMNLIELASIAEAREDWIEALARWQRVKDRFPMMGEPYRGIIRVLQQTDHHYAVDAVLRERVERFPDELGVHIDYAQNAYEGGDKIEIARRWNTIREHFPDCEMAYRNSANALAEIGRDEEAAAIRQEHQARFAA